MKFDDPAVTCDPDDPALAELGTWFFSAGGDEEAKTRTARELFGGYFLPSPPLSGPEEDGAAAFDAVMDGFSGNGSLDLQYDLPYPKWEFLHHLTTRRGFLLHGSGLALSELLPRPQDDWSGRPIEAVFATSDPIWSIFFATIDRVAVNGSIRNGGLLVAAPPDERYYFFSVQEGGAEQQMLRPGYVHLLERDGFGTGSAPVRFDEWHRAAPTRVVGRLEVSADDFPFRDSIARHPVEPVFATWSNYRKRISAP